MRINHLAGMATNAMDSLPTTSTGPFLRPPTASSQLQTQPALEPQGLVTPEAIQNMLASVNDIIFDCDGVLWHGKPPGSGLECFTRLRGVHDTDRQCPFSIEKILQFLLQMYCSYSSEEFAVFWRNR